MIVPLMKKLRSILSNNRHRLKQAFQEPTFPTINQQPVSKIHPLSQQQPQSFIVIISNNIDDFWDQKHSRNFTIKFSHTKKSFITRSIAVFVRNVGVFLFRKNHNRNPPEPAKNLAEQTEKPIKNQCKLCKTVSDTKNDQE